MRRRYRAMVMRTTVAFLGVVSVGCMLSCAPTVQASDGDGDGDGVANIPPTENGPSADLSPGGVARVTADFLNLREDVGTDANILIAMPCGASVDVLQGPSQNPVQGWWLVVYRTPENIAYTGWASGKFLVEQYSFSDVSCGSGTPVVDPNPTDDAGNPIDPVDGGGTTPVMPPSKIDAIFTRAKLGVGYSYWWGHGAWLSDGSNTGTCSGNCPSCTHGGAYGADCSGFVSKVWQVPSSTALGVDQHPFSSYNFFNEEIYWSQVSRDQMQPADAVTRRSGSDGHIALVEMTDDPYGSIWLYEARGCATGVVHNLRTVDSSYRTIRLNGL